MDLRQNKLTKEEWCALEVPVDEKEKRILKLIYDSWTDPKIRENSIKSYLEIVKINDSKSDYHAYFYKEIFSQKLMKLFKKHDIKIKVNVPKKQIKLKKKDIIRIKNLENKIQELKHNIFEFIILKFLKSFLSASSKKEYYHYIIINLLNCSVGNINKYVLEAVEKVLSMHKVNLKNIVRKELDLRIF